MTTIIKDQLTDYYLQATAKLLKIVNENRFQHFIRICIILNSLRYMYIHNKMFIEA